jgi:hypothetical protein
MSCKALKIPPPRTSLSAGIHAVNAIVTDGLNRDRIEPCDHINRALHGLQNALIIIVMSSTHPSLCTL